MAGRRGRWLGLVTRERRAVWARFEQGALTRDVAREFGMHRATAWRAREEMVLVRRRVLHSPHRLSFEEREEIFAGICRGLSGSAIARG
jgi:hypothetical protein